MRAVGGIVGELKWKRHSLTAVEGMAGTTRLELEAFSRRERAATGGEREPAAEILSAAKDPRPRRSGNVLAGTTRLELATSAVTGQRSNQLNYVPAFRATTRSIRGSGPANRFSGRCRQCLLPGRETAGGQFGC